MQQPNLNATSATAVAEPMVDQTPQPAILMTLGCVAHGTACLTTLCARKAYRGSEFAAILNWYQRLRELTGQSYQMLLASEDSNTAVPATSAKAFFEHVLATYFASLPDKQLADCVDCLLGEKATYLYCALEEKQEMGETGAAEVKQQLADLRRVLAKVAESTMSEYQSKRWQLLYEVIQHESINASTASTRSARRAAKHLLNVYALSDTTRSDVPSFAEQLLQSPTIQRLCAATDVPVSSLKTFGISAIARGAQGKGLTTADEIMQLWHLGFCVLTVATAFSQNTHIVNAAHVLLRRYKGRETDQPVDEVVLDAHIHHVQATESQVGRDAIDGARTAFERAVRDHRIPEISATLRKGVSRHFASCDEFRPAGQEGPLSSRDELMEFNRQQDEENWGEE